MPLSIRLPTDISSSSNGRDMNNALLISSQPRGARLCNGTSQRFTMVRRNLTTQDHAVCMWFRPTTRHNGGLIRTTQTSIGWNFYAVTDGRVFVRYGNGTGTSTVSTGTSLYNAGQWHYLVVNVDRSGNLDVYLDDMATPAGSADISALSAVDYAAGAATWYLGYDGVTTTWFNGALSRVGLVIGSTIDAAERSALYNAGRGVRYSQLAGDVLARFASQDYWDMWKYGGNELNYASPLRPLTHYNNPRPVKGP